MSVARGRRHLGADVLGCQDGNVKSVASPAVDERAQQQDP